MQPDSGPAPLKSGQIHQKTRRTRMSTPPLWDAVLRRLAGAVPELPLGVWLEPLQAEARDGELRLRCPTAFHRDRVRRHYLPLIREAVHKEAQQKLRVELDLIPPRPTITPRTSPKPFVPRRAAPERVPRERSRISPSGQLPFTFDSFIAGPNSALAKEASVAFASGRQLGAPTLFLASDPGLGKTHLARAAGAECQAALYTSAETFTSDFLACVRSQRMSSFKKRFRDGCDLLIVDDVQFLRGKKATQLELFFTIEHLAQAGRRVLLTGNRLPLELDDLEPQLRSRLTSGLVVEIEPPDAQVRRNILRAKAAAGGVRLPDDCLDLLVSSVRGSVRDLEGVLIQLVATATLLNRKLDRTLTEAALRKVRSEAPPLELRPEDVIELVAAASGTTCAALASRSRSREVLVPRQIAMYLCRRYTSASLQSIGRALGREHPSVKNAIAVVERGILERAPLRYRVEALCARLDERVGRAAPAPRTGKPSR